MHPTHHYTHALTQLHIATIYLYVYICVHLQLTFLQYLCFTNILAVNASKSNLKIYVCILYLMYISIQIKFLS